MRAVLRGPRAAVRRRADRDRGAAGTRSSSRAEAVAARLRRRRRDGRRRHRQRGAQRRGRRAPGRRPAGRRDERAAARAGHAARHRSAPPQVVAEALVAGRERRINLGVVNGRRFAFAAGVGADAQAVRLVDDARAAAGPAAGRRLLRGADHAHAAARRLPRAAARGLLRTAEVVAHGVQRLRGQRASLELRRAVRAQARPARHVRGRARRRRAAATCGGATCRATRRSCSSPAARRAARTSCSPTCTTWTTCACRASGRCRCTPTATISATSRRRSFGVARDAARHARMTPPLLFDLDGTLVDSRVVVERQWGALCARLGLDFPSVLAVLHGVRSVDTIRAVAPHVDAEAEAARARCARGGRHRRARARARARPSCSRACPPAAGASSRPGTARSRSGACAPSGLPVPAAMVCGDEVANGKPDPEGFLAGARLLGVAPGRCVACRGRTGGNPGRACRGHGGDRHHDDARAPPR